MKKNIVHFITGLNTGGAEMSLLKLISTSDNSKVNLLVVSLKDRGSIGEQMEKQGVKVVELNLSRFTPITFNCFKLLFNLLSFKPDIIQGWMYHANFLSYLYSYAIPKASIYWGIRQSLYSTKNEKIITRIIIYLCKLVSFRCDKIIYNSKKSLEQHTNYGFTKNNCEVIPNGFNDKLFSPSNVNRSNVNIRSELNIPEDVIVVGVVARNHPMKGYENFIKAASNILQTYPNVHFIAAGNKIEKPRFKHLLNNMNINSFHFLSEGRDISRLISIFDIAVSSSIWGEGFSNFICEAMLMEVPCVVTDVGDSKLIVDDFGIVVEPGSISSLSRGIVKMIEMPLEKRKEIGRKSRTRIIENFSLEILKENYEKLYGIRS